MAVGMSRKSSDMNVHKHNYNIKIDVVVLAFSLGKFIIGGSET